MSISIKRRRLLASVATMPLLSMASVSNAKGKFPERPIRLIVPFAAGGGTDIMARLIAQGMSQTLGVSVVVENRGGAGGSLGSDQVARSKPDGYTILMGTASTHAINPVVYSRLPYDATSDFTPLSLVATVPGVVVVNAKSPYQSFKGLVAEMKKKPGTLTYGSQGLGGLGNLMGEMLNAQAGVQTVHVPYRGGALALQDLLAGNIDIVYDTLPAVLPNIQGGNLRALVLTAPNRTAAAPDVPTTADEGFPDFLAQTWNGLFGPAGMPADIARQLTAAARQAVELPEIAQRIKELSAITVGSDGALLASTVQQDQKGWAKIASASKIKLD